MAVGEDLSEGSVQMTTARAFQRALGIALKSGVSLGLIVWLLFKIEIDQILFLWQDTDWMFLVLIAPMIFLACIVINIMRWKLILQQQGINVSFWNLGVIYIKGAFFGSFLPGGIAAGDIYRMYSLTKDIEKKAVSISSVLVDRAMGVFSVLGLSLGALCYSIFFEIHNELFTPLVKPVLLTTVLFSVVGTFFITFIRRGYLNKINSGNFVILKLKYFISTVPNYFSNKVILGQVVLLSLVFQFTIVLWTYAVAQALNISIPFLFICITTPLISLLTLLPISIGGLGVREAAYVFFLVPFGLEPSEAVSISVVSVLVQTILRLLSGSVVFGILR